MMKIFFCRYNVYSIQYNVHGTSNVAQLFIFYVLNVLSSSCPLQQAGLIVLSNAAIPGNPKTPDVDPTAGMYGGGGYGGGQRRRTIFGHNKSRGFGMTVQSESQSTVSSAPAP